MYGGAKLRSCLADIDTRISLLQSQLARLHADRANILENLGGVVYPVLTLPSEVTAEIFVQYVSWYPNEGCSPMVPAGVCSLWREVALSTPRLWTRLDPGHRFTVLESDGEYTRVAELLSMWLPRAGALPVDVRLRLPDPDLAEYEEIFRILGEYSPQLRVLDLFSPEGVDIPGGWLGPFPSLTKISFSTIWDEVRIPALIDAPQLREASFSKSEFPEDFNWQSSLPWNQLTILRVFQLEITDLLQILERTPNLELLDFQCDDDEADDQITTPPLVLPRLDTLILGEQRSHEIISFITLPALRKFHLAYPMGFCGRNVQEFVQRSGCTLADLYLLVEDSDDMEALRDFLRVSPTVRNLEINCKRTTDDGDTVKELLDVMCEPGSSFLPALSSFAISDCRTGVRLCSLVDMLAERTGGGDLSRLESFKLSFIERDHTYCCGNLNGNEEHRPVADLLAQLRELRSGGLKVDIHSAVDWFSDEINTTMIQEICGES